GSDAFARRIGSLRDAGRKNLVLAIGGPDGHGPSLGERADLILPLGAMTWPHQIARLVVAEQLYRAATILAGHPYHRARQHEFRHDRQQVWFARPDNEA